MAREIYDEPPFFFEFWPQVISDIADGNIRLFDVVIETLKRQGGVFWRGEDAWFWWDFGK